MIDTIDLNFPMIIPLDVLSPDWKLTTETDLHNEKWYTYKKEVPGLPTKFVITYRPISRYTNSALLKIYVGSVPKLLYGNNYQLVTDITEVVPKLNKYLRQIDGLKSIDAGKGSLHRVDFCTCYQVDTHVTDYLQAIHKLDFDHRNKSYFTNRRKLPYKLDKKEKGSVINGVLFASRNASTTFYDKQKECKSLEAFGLLRHEARIIGKKAIQQYTGLGNPKLEDLTTTIAEKILKQDLVRLSLDQEIYSEETAIAKLVTIYGATRGFKMYGFLTAINSYPDLKNTELAKKICMPYSSVCSSKKTLKKDGISLTLLPSSCKLPPLIVSFEEKHINSLYKVLGDTRVEGDLKSIDHSPNNDQQPGDHLSKFRSLPNIQNFQGEEGEIDEEFSLANICEN